MVQGSAADVAGLQQGDELLELDDNSLSALSPYQANLLPPPSFTAVQVSRCRAAAIAGGLAQCH